METLTNIKLYPVLRLSPFDFDEVIYPFKNQSQQGKDLSILERNTPQTWISQFGTHPKRITFCQDQ